MSETFSPSEVLRFAVTIEENGEKFYREASRGIASPKVKKLFGVLADEEVKHARVFQEFLKEVEDYLPPESYAGEYLEYLKTYSRDFIFKQEKYGPLMAAAMKGAGEALDYALGIEVDSILYYIEAKNFVPEAQKKALDKIIEEERRHYLKLSALKKEI